MNHGTHQRRPFDGRSYRAPDVEFSHRELHTADHRRRIAGYVEDSGAKTVAIELWIEGTRRGRVFLRERDASVVARAVQDSKGAFLGRRDAGALVQDDGFTVNVWASRAADGMASIRFGRIGPDGVQWGRPANVDGPEEIAALDRAIEWLVSP